MKPIPQTIEALAEVGRASDGPGLLAMLQEVGDAISAVVPDCVGLSIAWSRHGVTFTLVASDEEIAVFDSLQYLEDGPCVRAIDIGTGVATNHQDLMDEEAWRDFAEVTAARGIRSTLTFPIKERGRIVGSANLYGASEHAFEGQHDELARILGGWAPGAVRNADLAFTTLETARSAPASLRAEGVISKAMGLLMGRRQVDAATARQSLEDAAQRAGIRPEQLASALLRLWPERF